MSHFSILSLLRYWYRYRVHENVTKLAKWKYSISSRKEKSSKKKNQVARLYLGMEKSSLVHSQQLLMFMSTYYQLQNRPKTD